MNFMSSTISISLSRLIPLCMLNLALATALCHAQEIPNLESAKAEAIKILTGFIKVDTSNPPGNETKGAEYLKTYLEAEGIPAEIFELEKGRGNLVARLKGNGRKRPLLLMGHIDVVGVEREKWTVPPFEGIIKDGYLYGRGASDDKGMTSVCLQIMLMLKRNKIPLDRDVIFWQREERKARHTWESIIWLPSIGIKLTANMR